MKKISITLMVAGLLVAHGVHAQSLQDGVNDLYAERYKSAKATFEKLIAANPNNIDATYWLGPDIYWNGRYTGCEEPYMTKHCWQVLMLHW